MSNSRRDVTADVVPTRVIASSLGIHSDTQRPSEQRYTPQNQRASATVIAHNRHATTAIFLSSSVSAVAALSARIASEKSVISCSSCALMTLSTDVVPVFAELALPRLRPLLMRDANGSTSTCAWCSTVTPTRTGSCLLSVKCRPSRLGSCAEGVNDPYNYLRDERTAYQLVDVDLCHAIPCCAEGGAGVEELVDVGQATHPLYNVHLQPIWINCVRLGLARTRRGNLRCTNV